MALTLTDIRSTSLVQKFTCIRQNPGVDPGVLTPEQCQTISVNREVNLIQLLFTVTASAPGYVLHRGLPETLEVLLTSQSRDRQQNTLPTLAEFREFLVHLRRNGTPICLLTPAAALTLPVAATTASILSRVAPFRYSLSFAASPTLIAVSAGTAVFALLILLPPLLIFYNRRQLPRLRHRRGTDNATTSPSPSRDLDLARAFALFPIIGTLVLAAAPTARGAIAGVVILALGAPVPGLARAELSRLVDPAYRGWFFGLLAVVEQAGFLIVRLILSGFLDTGLRISAGRGGEQWLGMPLYVAALLFALLALGLWFAHPKEQQQPPPPLQHERREGEPEPEHVELGTLQERQAEGSGQTANLIGERVK
ncbi:hypothetical protein PG985_007102 [Apiospora marii]|uniref:uncharacterized protein n=1 Tax=Apiospora marii TaxID=335849 RepID=UPI00312F144F